MKTSSLRVQALQRLAQQAFYSIGPDNLSGLVGNEIIADFKHDVGDLPGQSMPLQAVRHPVFRTVGIIPVHRFQFRCRRSLKHCIGQPAILVMQDSEKTFALPAEIDRGKRVNSHQQDVTALRQTFIQERIDSLVKGDIKRLGAA